MSAMQDVLGGMLGGGAPGAAQPASLGFGPPPNLPNTPPAPTMMGAMPTGTKNLDAKGAADEAVLTLREAAGHFPNLAPDINALIDKLKSAAASGKGPGPSVDAPGPASIAGSSAAPVMESGSPGSM